MLWWFQDANFSPSSFITSELQRYNIDELDSSVMYTCYQKSVTVLGWGKFLPSLLSAHFLAVLEISICAYNPCMHTHTWFCCGPCGVTQINLKGLFSLMIVELVLHVLIPLLPKHMFSRALLRKVFCAKFSLMIAGFT